MARAAPERKSSWCVEDGLPVDTASAERLDQRASQARWPVPTIVAELVRGMASVELPVVFRVVR